MAERSNAISEITRFWLHARHGCLVYESMPVPVKYGQSDIDFLAVSGNLQRISLPDGSNTGPRLMVETKAEHDFDCHGKEFGKMLERDLACLGAGRYLPLGTKCKFTMLREEHFAKAQKFFGSDDIDRLFVVHAVDPEVIARNGSLLSSRRIHFLTIRQVVLDLYGWYEHHPRPSGLRHTLMGDIWHLLVGFCGCRPPDGDDSRQASS